MKNKTSQKGEPKKDFASMPKNEVKDIAKKGGEHSHGGGGEGASERGKERITNSPP